ncbi:hypothetical protein J3R83DRAFT_1183 [Lanmaoa asiatica]|nr:hypothetical protein J3R83DRAFT_1183 [Lanmaoa asiatica]
MFARPVVATTLLALVVAATATQTPASQCTTGNLQCCQSTSSTVTSTIATLLGSLGIDASGVALPIGVTCTPITVIGIGSGSTW